MAFTVGMPGGTKDYEYEAYVRLLEKAGVDVANTSRVVDPQTNTRWLYAWSTHEEAAVFAAKLKAETENPDWEVYTVASAPSAGPLGPVIVLVGRQRDGVSYSLSSSTKKLVQKKFPHAKQAPNVFISTTTQSDFEATQGPIWDQIAIILTGLSMDEIDQLGGYEVYDPASKEILRSSALVV